MQVSHFPATAANSLIEGYCDDFVALAAVLSQTLEQVSMRGLDISGSQPALGRIENGMRALADAIHELVQRLPPPRTPAIHKAASGPQAPQPDAAPRPAVQRTPTPNPPTQPTVAQPAAAPPLAPPSAAAQPRSTLPPGAQPTTAKPAAPQSPRTPQRQQPAPQLRPAAPPMPPHSVAQGSAPTSTSRAPAAKPSPVTAPHSPPQNDPQPRSATPPRTRDRAPDDESVLRGTNDSMPLLSVFQFLERTRKSGLLTVELSGETIRFGIAGGCVQSCLSSAPVAGERIGDLIVAAGLSDAATIEAAARELLADNAARDGRALGDMFVQRGLLTNGQLLELLEAQARQRFRRACGTRGASYAFAAGDPARTDGRMRVAPMELNHRASWDPEA